MGVWGPAVESRLVIEFYDDPKQTLEKSSGSVRYTTRGGADKVAEDFAQYTIRILSNLGEDPAASRLTSVLIDAFERLSKRSNVLTGPGFSLQLVGPRSGATKKCEADFLSNGGLKAKFSYGDESYYARMSCLLFLQYIIDNLDDDNLDVFTRAGRGFFGL
jgi:hypothetical protein